MTRQTLTALLLLSMMPISAPAQVTFERLLNAEEEPQNWLTYSGGYSSNRHTTLDQIGPANVDQLELAWIFQANSLEPFQATPLVVDGIANAAERAFSAWPERLYVVDAAGRIVVAGAAKALVAHPESM